MIIELLAFFSLVIGLSLVYAGLDACLTAKEIKKEVYFEDVEYGRRTN